MNLHLFQLYRRQIKTRSNRFSAIEHPKTRTLQKKNQSAPNVKQLYKWSQTQILFFQTKKKRRLLNLLPEWRKKRKSKNLQRINCNRNAETVLLKIHLSVFISHDHFEYEKFFRNSSNLIFREEMFWLFKQGEKAEPLGFYIK